MVNQVPDGRSMGWVACSLKKRLATLTNILDARVRESATPESGLFGNAQGGIIMNPERNVRIGANEVGLVHEPVQDPERIGA
jgi:hypothetical protein